MVTRVYTCVVGNCVTNRSAELYCKFSTYLILNVCSRKSIVNKYTLFGDKKKHFAWLSLEVLEQSRFSHESDVWAFGILMWEVSPKNLLHYSFCISSSRTSRFRQVGVVGVVGRLPHTCLS